MSQPLLQADRHEFIAELVRRQGKCSCPRPRRAWPGVTDETIRRDLSRLAELGIVRRSHGGAVAMGPGDEATTAVRLREHADEKIAIGRRAAALVTPGMRIILDSGTTCLCLARELRRMPDLVVATTAVTNALELLGNPSTTVVMVGGAIRPEHVRQQADAWRPRLSPSSESTTRFWPCTACQPAVAGPIRPSRRSRAKRAMIEAATEVTLLADHSKFGREALVRVAPLSSVQRIVTSPGVDGDELAAIREAGVEVIIAEP